MVIKVADPIFNGHVIWVQTRPLPAGTEKLIFENSLNRSFCPCQKTQF